MFFGFGIITTYSVWTAAMALLRKAEHKAGQRFFFFNSVVKVFT
jgi:hypothetical protein